MGEEGSRGGININTYCIDTVLNDLRQSVGQFGLVHVVLVLTHADGFRVDFHQLRQRVLDTPSD